MSVQPGKYIATIEDYGIKTVGDKNTPQLNIKFKIKETGDNVYFQNFLTEGTTNSDYFTSLMKNLVETGTLKTKRFTDIAKGKDGGALATDTELEIVVTEEVNADGEIQLDNNGNAYTKVKFINNPEKSGMQGLMSENEAISALGALNLDAHILQAEQSTGANIQQSNNTHSAQPEDVPF